MQHWLRLKRRLSQLLQLNTSAVNPQLGCTTTRCVVQTKPNKPSAWRGPTDPQLLIGLLPRLLPLTSACRAWRRRAGTDEHAPARTPAPAAQTACCIPPNPAASQKAPAAAHISLLRRANPAAARKRLLLLTSAYCTAQTLPPARKRLLLLTSACCAAQSRCQAWRMPAGAQTLAPA